MILSSLISFLNSQCDILIYFFDNNDRIRAQVMMFILSEYGISIDTDIFSLKLPSINLKKLFKIFFRFNFITFL